MELGRSGYQEVSKREWDHCHMKLRQRKEYGIDISTRYMERDQKLEIMIEMDLDVSYEQDETSVEPQEAVGEECGRNSNNCSRTR